MAKEESWEENEEHLESDYNKYFNTLLNKISDLKNASRYYKFIYNVLNDVVEFEMGIETAVARIQKETHGTSVEFEKESWVDNTTKKFSELIFIDGLIRMTGNMDKRDKIIDSYIENYMFARQGSQKNQLKELLENLSGGNT